LHKDTLKHTFSPKKTELEHYYYSSFRSR